MKTYANKLSDKFWNVILFVMKMFYYAIAAILLYRLFQFNYLIFLTVVCIIIYMSNPDDFKDQVISVSVQVYT